MSLCEEKCLLSGACGLFIIRWDFPTSERQRKISSIELSSKGRFRASPISVGSLLFPTNNEIRFSIYGQFALKKVDKFKISVKIRYEAIFN